MSNILRSDLPWQAAYISANVSRFYKILVKHNIVLDFAFYKLSLMYKITHNLIAIPISDFLISLVRPSWHYHPLSYRLITSTTDYYNFSFFPRVVVHWNNRPLETVACSTLEQFNQAVGKIDHVSPYKITILLLLNLTNILTYF